MYICILYKLNLTHIASDINGVGPIHEEIPCSSVPAVQYSW